jgi:hypothetical protein
MLEKFQFDDVSVLSVILFADTCKKRDNLIQSQQKFHYLRREEQKNHVQFIVTAMVIDYTFKCKLHFPLFRSITY